MNKLFWVLTYVYPVIVCTICYGMYNTCITKLLNTPSVSFLQLATVFMIYTTLNVGSYINDATILAKLYEGNKGLAQLKRYNTVYKLMSSIGLLFTWSLLYVFTLFI